MLTSPALAQAPSQLRTLLQQASDRYPALRVRTYEAEVLRQQAAVVRTARLPTLDATAQANVATYNNLTGMFYPTSLLPISGPPSTGNVYSPVTGTAAGLLMNWSPLTFGVVDSRVAVAQAELAVKLAQTADEKLRVQVGTAQAYMDALLGDELSRLAGQNIGRTDSLLRQVQALVTQGLRPEVDTALVVTEFSRAEIERINARNRADDARLKLAEWLARPDTSLTLTDTTLLTRLPNSAAGPTELAHPTELVFQRQIELEITRVAQIRRQFAPRLTFWGTTYARGSGVDYRGEVRALDGLLFSRFNYGVGAHLLVPLLRGPERSLLLTQQDFRLKAAAEQLTQTRLTLDTQRRSARLLRQQAEEIARQMLRQVTAARQALIGLQSRYASGLVSLTDVLQAQYTLLRAESDQKATTLSVWRGRLLEAYAEGDINLFLQALN